MEDKTEQLWRLLSYKHFRTIENKKLKLSREDFIIWLHENYLIKRKRQPHKS